MSARKIFLNTILQSIGKIISLAVGFLVTIFLTRYLKEEGFGEYITVITYMGFFGILADLGLYLITAQLISKEGADEKKILGNIFSLRIISVLIALSAGVLLSLFFPYSTEVKSALFLAIINFVLVSGNQVLVGVFQKYLIFYKLVGSEIVGRLVALATTLIFIRMGYGLPYFIISLTLASLFHFAISLHIARRMIPFRLEFDYSYWRYILGQSWPLAFSVVLNLIYFRADTLILSVIKSTSEVGVYGAAYKVFEVLLNFPAMFAGLIMPFLTRFAYKDWGNYRLYLQKSFDALLLIIVPMVASVLAFAQPVIKIVAGEGFAFADQILKILAFAAAITFLGNLLGYTVVALNLQKKMVWGYLTGAVAGLFLYYALIPRYSYFGAAAATVLVEFLVAVWAYFLTSSVTKFYPSFFILVKALLAITPPIFIFALPSVIWPLKLLTGLVIYCCGLLLLGALPKEFLKQLIKKTGDEKI